MTASIHGTIHGPTRHPHRAIGRAAVLDAHLTPAGTVRVVIEDADEDKELWLTLDAAHARRLRDRIADALRAGADAA